MRSKQTKASTAELYDIRANLSRVKQNKNIGVGIRAWTKPLLPNLSGAAFFFHQIINNFEGMVFYHKYLVKINLQKKTLFLKKLWPEANAE